MISETFSDRHPLFFPKISTVRRKEKKRIDGISNQVFLTQLLLNTKKKEKQQRGSTPLPMIKAWHCH